MDIYRDIDILTYRHTDIRLFKQLDIYRHIYILTYFNIDIIEILTKKSMSKIRRLEKTKNLMADYENHTGQSLLNIDRQQYRLY